MRRATLLFNPQAGRGRGRVAVLQTVREALSSIGIEGTLQPTAGPRTAGEQAREAARTSEIVFVCGGDGTVHEALQGLAGQIDTALGVLPLGSANVLARHLQLSLDPVRAALEQVGRAPVAVPLGRVTYRGKGGEETRFFAAVAGAGADGWLARQVGSSSKRRLGRWAYPLRAGQLCLWPRLAPFAVTGTLTNGRLLHSSAISLMCSRVMSLGALPADELDLTLIRGPAWSALPLWVATSWTGLERLHTGRTSHRLRSVSCGAGQAAPVYVQADGEWLGETPMTMDLVSDAVRLFCPAVTLP